MAGGHPSSCSSPCMTASEGSSMSLLSALTLSALTLPELKSGTMQPDHSPALHSSAPPVPHLWSGVNAKFLAASQRGFREAPSLP